jgi:serine/threonine-protein kinase RsbW
MNMRQPNALVGETGQAVVDPRYRGHGLFEKMKSYMMNHAHEKGMYGVYSEAVAVHPYSQKGNLALGAYETGLLLGFTPATMFFKDIQDKSKDRRQSCMLFYAKVNQEPMRDVYPPFHHQTMIRRIYERNNLRRNIRALADIQGKIELAPVSLVDVDVHTEPNRAFMRITAYGQDLAELVKFRLRELCLRRIDCVYIDLPLSNPATAQSCASLEMLGFFFAGIIPELFDGDVLRLQYLNNVDIDPKDISTASDFGKALLDYVLKSKESIVSPPPSSPSSS